MFCIDWNADLQPTNFAATIGTKFLECQVDLAENGDGYCDYSPLVTTKFWQFNVFEGAYKSIWDQTCYAATS